MMPWIAKEIARYRRDDALAAATAFRRAAELEQPIARWRIHLGTTLVRFGGWLAPSDRTR